jgi:hypothetical protein
VDQAEGHGSAERYVDLAQFAVEAIGTAPSR